MESIDLAVLEQKRQQLSLDALEGREGAAEALTDVEQQIAAARVAAERAQLADRERLARAEAEEQTRQETRRREMEAQLAELWRNRLPLAAEIEEATDALASALSRAFFLGDEMVRLTHQLTGRLNRRLDLRDAVLGFVKWKLPPQLGLGRPHGFYRRPLRAILSGQAREASGQEPATPEGGEGAEAVP